MKKLILPLLTPALICASMLLSGQAFALSSVKVFIRGVIVQAPNIFWGNK